MPLAVALRSALDTLSEPHLLEVVRSRRRHQRRESRAPRALARVAAGRASLRRAGPARASRESAIAAASRTRPTSGSSRRSCSRRASRARSISTPTCCVAADLARLWAEPQRGLPVLAVRDAGAPTSRSPRGLLNHRELGLAPDLRVLQLGRDDARPRALARGGARRASSCATSRATRTRSAGGTRTRSTPCWPAAGASSIRAGTRFPSSGSRSAGDTDPFPRGAARARDPRSLDRALLHGVEALALGLPHPARARFFEVLDRTAWAGWRPRRSFRDSLVWRKWRGLSRRLQALRPARSALG